MTSLKVSALDVSTHSRLKAAGIMTSLKVSALDVSTHSRLKAAGCVDGVIYAPYWFQHTAA